MQKPESINQLIRNRRSVYPGQYIAKPIDPELLLDILENANHAPTHRLTQPWRFKVVSGEQREKLGQFMARKYEELTEARKFMPPKKEKTFHKCLRADKILLICLKRDPKESVPEWEEIASVAMAVQNIYLSCSALGIGCYWSTPKAIHHMHEFCELDEGEKCIGLFYMGYYEEGKVFPKSPRTPIEDKVVWL